MSTYLGQFRNFAPDPDARILAEFTRLANLNGWARGSSRYKRERGLYLFSEYDQHLGDLDKPDKLEQLQTLCSKLGVRGQPASITQCKKVGL